MQIAACLHAHKGNANMHILFGPLSPLAVVALFAGLVILGGFEQERQKCKDVIIGASLLRGLRLFFLFLAS